MAPTLAWEKLAVKGFAKRANEGNDLTSVQLFPLGFWHKVEDGRVLESLAHEPIGSSGAPRGMDYPE